MTTLLDHLNQTAREYAPFSGIERTSFVADISSFRLNTTRKMVACLRMSVQEVIDSAQKPVAQGGNMPVDTGFLRNSIVVDIGDVSRPLRGQGMSRAQRSAAAAPAYEAKIAGAKIGDTIRVTWTANYAIYQELKRFFVRAATERWSGFVARNASKLSQRKPPR